jgi:hypothetical protein
MKITILREAPTVVGVVQGSGQFVEKRDGGWMAIDAPAWAAEKPSQPAPEPHPMTDPHKRETTAIPLVTLRRVITKTVPDYEAEVLLRSGWERVE